MEDERIVALYWERDERAIRESRLKYGPYCRAIAYRILQNAEDAEECEADAYLSAWESMPPHKPPRLSTFLGMLTRRISLDRFRHGHAAKRGGGEVMLSLDELEDCVPDGQSVDEELVEEALAALITDFLRALPEVEGDVFLRRYWYFDSIREIGTRYGFGESRVKMMLLRTREKLRERLMKEGVFL